MASWEKPLSSLSLASLSSLFFLFFAAPLYDPFGWATYAHDTHHNVKTESTQSLGLSLSSIFYQPPASLFFPLAPY